MYREVMIQDFLRWVPQESRENVVRWLERYQWDFKAATDAYWRQNILIY